MPTYEYVCDACRHEFEAFQSIKEAVLVKCPKCGRKKLRRKIGAGAAIIFKGSGFYETDYRKTAEKKDKPAGESSPAEKPVAAPAEKGPAKSDLKAKS